MKTKNFFFLLVALCGSQEIVAQRSPILKRLGGDSCYQISDIQKLIYGNSNKATAFKKEFFKRIEEEYFSSNISFSEPLGVRNLDFIFERMEIQEIVLEVGDTNSLWDAQRQTIEWFSSQTRWEGLAWVYNDPESKVMFPFLKGNCLNFIKVKKIYQPTPTPVPIPPPPPTPVPVPTTTNITNNYYGDRVVRDWGNYPNYQHPVYYYPVPNRIIRIRMVGGYPNYQPPTPPRGGPVGDGGHPAGRPTGSIGHTADRPTGSIGHPAGRPTGSVGHTAGRGGR